MKLSVVPFSLFCVILYMQDIHPSQVKERDPQTKVDDFLDFEIVRPHGRSGDDFEIERPHGRSGKAAISSTHLNDTLMAEPAICRDSTDAAIACLLKVAHALRSPGEINKEAEYAKIMKTLTHVMPDRLRVKGDSPEFFHSAEQSIAEMVPVLNQNLDEEWYVANPEIVTTGVPCSSISIYGDFLLFVSSKQKDLILLYHMPTKHTKALLGTTADFTNKDACIVGNGNLIQVCRFNPDDPAKPIADSAASTLKDMRAPIKCIKLTNDRLIVLTDTLLLSCQTGINLFDFKALTSDAHMVRGIHSPVDITLVYQDTLLMVLDRIHSVHVQIPSFENQKIEAAALLFNNNIIASFKDGIRIYDIESKTWSNLMKIPMSPAIACAFTQIDPRVVAVAYDDCTIAFWNFTNKTPVGKRFTRAKSNGRIIKLDFNVETNDLWVGYSSGLVEKYNLKNIVQNIILKTSFT